MTARAWLVIAALLGSGCEVQVELGRAIDGPSSPDAAFIPDGGVGLDVGNEQIDAPLIDGASDAL